MSGVRHVLVVEDRPSLRTVIQCLLEANGYRVSSASDGVQALRVIEEATPDIIVADIMMPRMSGFEVCGRLKADPATADIPVVMVTALNELGDIERAVAAGTDDFLSKPINKLELLTRVKSLLRVRHLKGELERTLAYLQQVDSPKRS